MFPIDEHQHELHKLQMRKQKRADSKSEDLSQVNGTQHTDDERALEFYRFDKDKNNQLCTAELEAAGLSDVIRQWDKNGDGSISFKEFLESFSPKAVLEEQKQDYIVMDVNQDG